MLLNGKELKHCTDNELLGALGDPFPMAPDLFKVIVAEINLRRDGRSPSEVIFVNQSVSSNGQYCSYAAPDSLTPDISPYRMVEVPPPEAAPQYEVAAKLGIISCLRIVEDGDSFRCCQCCEMQPHGSSLVWVPDCVRMGDPAWSIHEAARRGKFNGHASAWCLDCAKKLTKSAENISPNVTLLRNVQSVATVSPVNDGTAPVSPNRGVIRRFVSLFIKPSSIP